MNTTVKQCKQCKRLFQSLGSEYCPDCARKLEENFDIVRKYIDDHPHANVMEIAQETGVPEKDILYFLKEGRLSIVEGAGMLSCENCGRPISTGRYCERCKGIFEKQLSAVLKDGSPGAGRPYAQMHIKKRKD